MLSAFLSLHENIANSGDKTKVSADDIIPENVDLYPFLIIFLKMKNMECQRYIPE